MLRMKTRWICLASSLTHSWRLCSRLFLHVWLFERWILAKRPDLWEDVISTIHSSQASHVSFYALTIQHDALWSLIDVYSCVDVQMVYTVYPGKETRDSDDFAFIALLVEPRIGCINFDLVVDQLLFATATYLLSSISRTTQDAWKCEYRCESNFEKLRLRPSAIPVKSASRWHSTMVAWHTISIPHDQLQYIHLQSYDGILCPLLCRRQSFTTRKENLTFEQHLQDPSLGP